MSDILQEWWAVIIAFITSIVWLVRLEARGIYNGAEIRRLWIQRKEDLESAKEGRELMNKRLDIIGADIKTILSSMPRD
jgi:hypothetical protein